MKRTSRTCAPGAALLALLLAAGCNEPNWGPDQLGAGHTSLSLRQMQLGRDVYATYCAGCHGESGDGNGPAARFLDPKPRDFRIGKIKFAAVASGDSPRVDDYNRIISHGLSGTAMPSFALLSDRERLAVIAYVRTFNPGWQKEQPGAPIAVGKDPFADRPAKGIEEGKRAYHAMAKCWACHPAYATPAEIAAINREAKLPEPELRPNPYESEAKESDWGAPIRPPDFLTDRIKNGFDEATLTAVISAGVGGTAMPQWAGALSDDQLWGLAYYVRSLALQRGTPQGKALQQMLKSQPLPPRKPAEPDSQEGNK
jgi:cytochrome c oxidase cbb3-type subunit I/II